MKVLDIFFYTPGSVAFPHAVPKPSRSILSISRGHCCCSCACAGEEQNRKEMRRMRRMNRRLALMLSVFFSHGGVSRVFCNASKTRWENFPRRKTKKARSSKSTPIQFNSLEFSTLLNKHTQTSSSSSTRTRSSRRRRRMSEKEGEPEEANDGGLAAAAEAAAQCRETTKIHSLNNNRHRTRNTGANKKKGKARRIFPTCTR